VNRQCERGIALTGGRSGKRSSNFCAKDQERREAQVLMMPYADVLAIPEGGAHFGYMAILIAIE
jgi:hypothetical protein